MGSGSGGGGEGSSSMKKQQQQSSSSTSLKYKLMMLGIVMATNLFTISIFTAPSHTSLQHHLPSYLGWMDTESETGTESSNGHNHNVIQLLQELNHTRSRLAATHTQIAELHQKLSSTNELVDSLLAELNPKRVQPRNQDSSKPDIADLPDEVKLAIGPHKLPLGFAPRFDSDELHAPVGYACLANYREDVVEYMSYEVGGECPVDDIFSQKLMLKGCDPLPRRRCHPRSPAGYVDPAPFPQSLWTIPSDTSIIWDPYPCKSYQCLIDRRDKPGFYDCKDCFYLEGKEKVRWLMDDGSLNYGIDQVLQTRPPGTIRIGVDIGGGTGSFAARMRERNITIVTTSMNFDGPFNSFIASRGLIAMHLSVSQRLPFFENTLDIVHSMHVLNNWIPNTILEFTLYDIYRVLRPGGLFWVDHFYCFGSQLNQTYVPMFNRIGFSKLRWNIGRKLDKGIESDEWYLSALLEKPK